MDIRTEEILSAFPGLLYDAGFEITSPEDTDYNCIAWAFGRKDRWLWPDEETDGVSVWPEGSEECTHASRQLPDGKWTSKLGSSFDICHSTPYTIQGRLYGMVSCILCRNTR
jgi:hypothetical protein